MPDAIFTRPGPLGAIAQGIRNRLQLIFPPERFDHQWMPPKVTRAAWKTLMRRPPLVGIGFNRFYRVQGQSTLAVISEWSIFLAIKNEGGQEGLLFGDNFASGFFMVAEVGASAVHGYTIPDQGTIQVVSADNVTVEEEDDPALAIATIEITVNADLSLKNVLGGAAVTPASLRSQDITWAFGDATVADIITNPGTS